MNKTFILLTGLLLINTSCYKKISGSELLDKSIQFHDPSGNWQQLGVQLTFAQESTTNGQYERKVAYDNVSGYFSFYQKDNEKTIDYLLDKGECEIKLNGSSTFSDEDASKYRLSCERVNMYRDYYTYLYGLPMKLNDAGTIIDPEVSEQWFDGETYWVMKVNYDESVGSDTWYFYFDQSTYELSGYRFYHDESANDGEYITLDGMVEYQGIKIPKTRKWYYNKDDKYLGTDDLINAGPIN